MIAVDVVLAFLGVMFAVYEFVAVKYRRFPTITAVVTSRAVWQRLVVIITIAMLLLDHWVTNLVLP